MSRLQRSCRSGLLAALCAGVALGCAYAKRSRDVDRTPVVDTGVGARIIYPGQSAAMPGAPAGTTAQPGTAPETQDPSGADVQPGTGSFTFIGGANQDEQRHMAVDEEPLYYKYLLLPFAVAAAPFAAAAEALRGEEEPGPAVPEPGHAKPAAAAPPAPVDYESARLEAMERELDGRAAGDSGSTQAAVGMAAPVGGTVSIADELAALQRTPTQTASVRREPPAATRPTGADVGRAARGERPFAAADGIVDRDDDGRVDQWIFREDGEIVRNVFDDDGDGRPDRTLHYDRQTHRIARVDEDTDRDGAFDSWTEYREGEIVRRRADADGDGAVDSWSYYRDDQIARHESDTTGDGFSDRVRFYEGGELAREEQDNDGDGQAEVRLHYDGQQQIVRREEDTDGDGDIDVVSHYENGRLVRRELRDPTAAAPGTP